MDFLYQKYKTEQWLPTSLKEVQERGWEQLDVILFTGDAYIDHPSFGAAVIGRILEAEGLKVGIVPQPNWQDDLRDFKKMGIPRLFFAVTGGNMDSMVNHYTANKRKRSTDAYTPGGESGKRPDYATVVYCTILKKLYPDIPLVIGGIEASLRRVTHYDYWEDRLHPSILKDSGADLLFYGMGEKSIIEYARLVQRGVNALKLTNIPQTAFLVDQNEKYATQKKWNELTLASHEECLQDKKKYAKNFMHIEEESNKVEASKLIQHIGNQQVVVNPPWPPLEEQEIDRFYDLPFTRLPHPRYKNKSAIPAYEMIRHSVNIHRGCFGGCTFCTISAHQGKFIASRSEKSILKEVEQLTMMPDFKGYISDLGGPSANMYKMKGIHEEICRKCKRPSCVFPDVCKNLNTDHQPMLDLYRKVRQHPKVKKAFIGSGIRYDMILKETGNQRVDASNREYLREIVKHHVSGRLKIAPEHTSDQVLKMMRKPSFSLFYKFKEAFEQINKSENLNQQLIPYFISSHPGCHNTDMANLAVETKKLDFKLEQVQDFTPTPMTVATVIYYSGYHPYTMEKVYTAKSQKEKLAQRKFFFWYKREYHNEIKNELLKQNRKDLLDQLFTK
ncbi:MAG: YgiQ family radical SAM protein [Bacteroidetes bacterium GWF2_42_66]|nr:MAG: YgiQ family radical SAM protein [Bacteroidetes bacterium GWE2_42_39]OFY41872.1 MAG: YgiQ family radical SAM protein [Bacteroidetes bacterium GWF2_42_66]HBL77951.1 YgiQ family radical SAM protein [Prolixibacteraceae bacterium]HCU63432.1 YgiQ family radical SAM protein [Prolixibacteraceae bacterium]